MDNIEKIKQLKELLDADIITNEEFEKKKNELLFGAAPTRSAAPSPSPAPAPGPAPAPSPGVAPAKPVPQPALSEPAPAQRAPQPVPVQNANANYGNPNGAPVYQVNANTKVMNKHIFAWVGCFLFGGLGVDRFMRGQVGLGILKLLTGGALGVWALIDWIIALTKVYGSAYNNVEDVIFINGQYSK